VIRISCSPATLCRSSVLKVPLAWSNTSSEEKLGPTGWAVGAARGASAAAANVRAGFLLKVKVSTSASKSKAAAGRAGAAAVRAGAKTAWGALPATLKRLSRAGPAGALVGWAGRARRRTWSWTAAWASSSWVLGLWGRGLALSGMSESASCTGCALLNRSSVGMGSWMFRSLLSTPFDSGSPSSPPSEQGSPLTYVNSRLRPSGSM